MDRAGDGVVNVVLKRAERAGGLVWIVLGGRRSIGVWGRLRMALRSKRAIAGKWHVLNERSWLVAGGHRCGSGPSDAVSRLQGQTKYC